MKLILLLESPALTKSFTFLRLISNSYGSSGVSTGSQGGTPPPEMLFASCLPPPPKFFQKFLLKIQCFLSKLFDSFFDFVRVAFFILLNAIFSDLFNKLGVLLNVLVSNRGEHFNVGSFL